VPGLEGQGVAVEMWVFTRYPGGDDVSGGR